MSIKEQYKLGKVSTHTYNICRAHNILSVQDLIEYYQNHKSFDQLKGCGMKSYEELTTIYKENYIDNGDKTKLRFVDRIKEVVSNLSRTQREVINSFISIKVERLTVRSKNALRKYLDENIRIRNVETKILSNKEFDFFELKNIGAKCSDEIQNCLAQIKFMLKVVYDSKDPKHLLRLKNKFLIQDLYSVDKIPADVLDSESIFSIIQFLIEENLLLGERYTPFLKTLNIYNNNKVELTELVKKFAITKERVRQSRLKCSSELGQAFRKLSNLEDNLLRKFNIDNSLPFIDINDKTLDLINKTSRTQFSLNFINVILSSYYSNLTLIGNLKDVLITKSSNNRNRHNWKNVYIGNKYFIELFNFQKFTNDVSKRLDKTIDDSYSFHFKSYLTNFLLVDDMNMLNEIIPLCESIINKEFEMSLDINDNLTFQRTTKIRSYEYSYEALLEIGEPAKVKVITEKINSLHQAINITETKVRASLKRKHGFVPIGRKSVFGLKKWELELANFRGGTIRDITKEYLRKNKTPQHISKIAKYVQQFRPKTYERSVHDNLKADDSKDFIFFKNAHVGLNEIEYDENSLRSMKITRSSKSKYTIKELKDFIMTNQRVPNARVASEAGLYRFYYRNKKRISTGDIEIENIKDFQEIINKISPKRSRFSLEVLLDFVKEQKRLPKSASLSESKLLHYYYRQKTKYLNDKMNIKEQATFKQIEEYGK